MDKGELEQAILSYWDGSLDKAGQLGLTEALKSSAEARRLFASYMRHEGTMHKLAEASLISSATDLRDEGQIKRRRSVKPRPVRLNIFKPMYVALAASLLFVIAAVWFQSASVAVPMKNVASITALNQALTLIRNGETINAAVGDVLFSDDVLKTAASGTASITFIDQSVLRLAAASTLRCGHQRHVLETGIVDCQITPQQPGQQFQIKTPHALVAVLGTAFTVSVTDQRSRLEVSSGAVSFSTLDQQQSRIVRADQWAEINAAGDLIPRQLPDDAVRCWDFNDITKLQPFIHGKPVAVAGFNQSQDPANHALRFNGSDDYLAIAHDDVLLLPTFTICFWFKPDVATFKERMGERQGLFSKDANGFGDGGHCSIQLFEGRILARQQSDQASYVVESAPLRESRWYHCALSVGAGKMNLHIDGKPAIAAAYTGERANEFNRRGAVQELDFNQTAAAIDYRDGLTKNHNGLVIGADTLWSAAGTSDKVLRAFKGDIDDVRIYAQVLTEPELAAVRRP